MLKSSFSTNLNNFCKIARVQTMSKELRVKQMFAVFVTKTLKNSLPHWWKRSLTKVTAMVADSLPVWSLKILLLIAVETKDMKIYGLDSKTNSDSISRKLFLALLHHHRLLLDLKSLVLLPLSAPLRFQEVNGSNSFPICATIHQMIP